MKPDQPTNDDRAKKVAEHLRFLKLYSKSTEDYPYLLFLQEDKAWITDQIEDSFSLGEKVCGEYYSAGQWRESVHPKDRPFLEADVEALCAGRKDVHNMDYRVANKDGGYTWINCRGTVEKDENGNPFLLIGRISETALRYRVDALTSLFNLKQLSEDMKAALEMDKKGYLLLLGIDNMKNINIIHGWSAGNDALLNMAEILESMKESQKLYRSGGDIFAVPLYDLSMEQVEDFFLEVQKKASGKFTISGGAVPLDLPGMDAVRLMQYAEFALNTAKKQNKNNITFFHLSDYKKAAASASLLSELVESVQNDCQGFSLVYQPQIRLGSYKIFGAEALLRYQSPSRGPVFPDEFIPILEGSELMPPVGMWVLKEALKQCKEWRKVRPDFHMSVNISYFQLSRPRIAQQVLDALRESGLPGSALTLEVTESMQLENFKYYNEIFTAWKKEGIAISVDDFGTGYSSLGYLKNLDIDEIKIDRCFVSGIHTSNYNYLLLSNMIDLAEDSQIRVCCEGVENTNELRILEELRPTLLQGFLFSRPCTKEDFQRLAFDKNAPEYQQYLSNTGKIKERHFSALLNIQHRDVLRSVNVGLWILRTSTDSGIPELYADETTRRILGMPKNLTPADAYQFWSGRISPEHAERVQETMKKSLTSDSITYLKYTWNHPELQTIELYGAGLPIEVMEGELCLHGYLKTVDNSLKQALTD